MPESGATIRPWIENGIENGIEDGAEESLPVRATLPNVTNRSPCCTRSPILTFTSAIRRPCNCALMIASCHGMMLPFAASVRAHLSSRSVTVRTGSAERLTAGVAGSALLLLNSGCSAHQHHCRQGDFLEQPIVFDVDVHCCCSFLQCLLATLIVRAVVGCVSRTIIIRLVRGTHPT